jgi:hypothetical protein
MASHVVSQLAWERMVTAVEKVRERLRRAAAALEAAQIPYAVIGGNAVAAWVSEVDEAAVRNTRDVDILLRRADLDRAKEAMTTAGFIYRHVKGIDMFLDGPGTRARDAVHIIFAGEKVRPDDAVPAPDVTDAKVTKTVRTVSLEGLVRMKLVANRRKDQVHVLDMIDVGLVDATWCARLPPELSERLQAILDTPEG